jgi:hypothetical protein
MRSKDKDKFVGVQISPISFIDEGVDQVLNTLINRVGVNVLLIGGLMLVPVLHVLVIATSLLTNPLVLSVLI